MGVIYKNGVRYGGSGTGNGDSIQVSSMPAASSLLVDKIIQYVGPTTLEYTNGYFYKCIEDKTTTPTSYYWEAKEVQPTYTPEKLGIGYGICSTAEATLAKEATLSDYELITNGIVAIQFINAVPANSTLSINSKGAKNIYYKGAAIVAKSINAGDIATFIYDGTNYQLLTTDSLGGDPVAPINPTDEPTEDGSIWITTT